MLKNLSLIIICFILASCVSSVDQLRQANLQGNSFQVALAKQYLNFAESEADQYDWFNSAYFARKGLKAVNGETPPPEDLKKWDLPEDILPTIVQAREYLVSVLTPDIIKKFPEQSSTAQFMFDCWVEQQEENWQQEDIARCREGFYNVLDNIFALTSEAVIERPAEEPVAVKQEKVQETRLAYFKTGSDKLDDGVERLVSNIVSRLKDSSSYDITLNGYADMVGGEDYNMKLSRKRGIAIKKALVEAGLNEKSITVFAFGQSEMRVKTKKGVPSKENRVVEIVMDIR